MRITATRSASSTGSATLLCQPPSSTTCCGHRSWHWSGTRLPRTTSRQPQELPHPSQASLHYSRPTAAAKTLRCLPAVASNVPSPDATACAPAGQRALHGSTCQKKRIAKSTGRQDCQREARLRRSVGRVQGAVRMERDARDGAALHGPGHRLAGVALTVACVDTRASSAAPGIAIALSTGQKNTAVGRAMPKAHAATAHRSLHESRSLPIPANKRQVPQHFTKCNNEYLCLSLQELLWTHPRQSHAHRPSTPQQAQGAPVAVL